ncbi:MAG: hypothetical protein FWD73_08480 [Polyangiaceae bacterium]|nr:hypothetical protein [Polyangiaceae bacterium]
MRLLFAALVVTALDASSCKDLDPPPPPPFRIGVKVEGDPGQPLGGATITRGSTTLASTGQDGRATFALVGADGDSTEVAITCPEGFQSPNKPTTIKFTRYADPKQVPEYAISCPPSRRHIVVAIKADNGAHLPVKYLEKVVARTDGSGAAHFSLDAMPGENIIVALDTSNVRRIVATQQNPSTSFRVHDIDEIFVWEQKFALAKPPPAPRGPRGPVLIQSPR